MENCYRFYTNHECEYFPCHTQPDTGIFNCLFCFCPLYAFADQCGGIFKYSGVNNIKNCEDCHLPHLPEYYDTIIARLTNATKKDNL